MTPSVDDINSFIRSREVELVLSGLPNSDGIALRAEYEGHGDFFTMSFVGIAFLELPGRFTLGGVATIEDPKTISGKWARIRWLYSGPAYVFWSSDAETMQKAKDDELFLVVADEVTIRPGLDWG